MKILIKIYTFSLKNAFENVVWEMAAILSRPQCVKRNMEIRFVNPSNINVIRINIELAAHGS